MRRSSNFWIKFCLTRIRRATGKRALFAMQRAYQRVESRVGCDDCYSVDTAAVHFIVKYSSYFLVCLDTRRRTERKWSLVEGNTQVDV